MPSTIQIEIEGRIRRGWLAKGVLHLLLPLVTVGLIDRCTAVRLAVSVIRSEYRFVGSTRWRPLTISYEVMCDDDDDGGYPVQAAAA